MYHPFGNILVSRLVYHQINRQKLTPEVVKVGFNYPPDSLRGFMLDIDRWENRRACRVSPDLIVRV
jgi:hypothetical protein